MKICARLLLLPLILGCGALSAATIDFNTLPGSNGDVFSTYTENGFTIASTAGFWEVGKNFGNPVPDVFCQGCGPGTLEVTGGLFSFSSVDLGNPFISAADPLPYTIMGFLSGIQVLTQTGSLLINPVTFMTVNSVNTSQVLDSLFISIDTSGVPWDGNIDNVVLTSSTVPEPTSLILLAFSGYPFATPWPLGCE
jgi:hypothetical protein